MVHFTPVDPCFPGPLIAFPVEITGGFDRNFMAVTKLRPIFEYYLLESSSSKFQDILTSRNTVIDVYMYFLFHLKRRWTRLPSNNNLPWVKVTVNVRALEVLCNKTLHSRRLRLTQLVCLRSEAALCTACISEDLPCHYCDHSSIRPTPQHSSAQCHTEIQPVKIRTLGTLIIEDHVCRLVKKPTRENEGP